MVNLSFKLIRLDENGVKHYVQVTKEQFVSEVTSDNYKPKYIECCNDLMYYERYPVEIEGLQSELRYAEYFADQYKDSDIFGVYSFYAVAES